MSAQHTPGRRVAQTAYGHTVFVRPSQPMPHAEWSAWFELRALRAGYLAVIDGAVVEPVTSEARAAIAKATGSAS